jgi:two-component system sensor histidine kinase/response regulator
MIEKNTILIIDDNPVNIQLAGRILKDENIEILFASNGFDGLHIAKKQVPDLILLDIMMPEMDGFTVCKYLKEEEITKNIPIIFLTAKTGKSDVVDAFRAGAVDFIVKPFNTDELILRVRTHLIIKSQQKIIERKNLELEQANLEKNELLGIAAHDLKNPINNISMLAKIMLEDDSVNKAEVKEFSNDILNISKKMNELIRNLLDINAIEQGKVKITIESVFLDIICTGMINVFNEAAKQKNIIINYENTSEKSLIISDYNATVQIFDNLISNAIKFSDFNKEIFVQVFDEDDNVKLSIKDQGPGFSEADKVRLWGKFSRLSAQPTNNENSTGLGLSIVKKYVEMCNGSIELNSEKGKGAEFNISFKKAEV